MPSWIKETLRSTSNNKIFFDHNLWHNLCGTESSPNKICLRARRTLLLEKMKYIGKKY
jgi:hypothetical protein